MTKEKKVGKAVRVADNRIVSKLPLEEELSGQFQLSDEFEEKMRLLTGQTERRFSQPSNTKTRLAAAILVIAAVAIALSASVVAVRALLAHIFSTAG